MKTLLVINFCALFILSNYKAAGILSESDETVTKPSVQEILPWDFQFAEMPPKRSIYEDDEIPVPPQERAALFDSNPKTFDNNGDFTKCPPGATGSFHYPLDCKRFLNCWKGRGTVQVCAPGTLFNPETQECDFPNKVNCNPSAQPLSQPYVRFPEGRPEIPPNPRISRKDHYQVAETSFGDAEVVRPYPGRPPYFGSSHLNRPTARPTTPKSPSGRLENSRPVCPEGATGLFPHPFDCHKFLNCWDGRTFVQMCGPGTVFNPAMSVCDHPHGNLCANNQGGDLSAYGTENKEESYVLPSEYVRGPPNNNYGRNEQNQPQGQQNVPLKDPHYNSDTNLYSPNRDPKSREPSYRPNNSRNPPPNTNNHNYRPNYGYPSNNRPIDSSDLFGKPTAPNPAQPQRPPQRPPSFPGSQGQTSNSNFFEEEEPTEPTRRPPKSFPPYPSSQGQVANSDFGEDQPTEPSRDKPKSYYGQKLPSPQNQKKPDHSYKNKIKYDAYGNPISPSSLDQQKPYSNSQPTPPSYGWKNPPNQQPTPQTRPNSYPSNPSHPHNHTSNHGFPKYPNKYDVQPNQLQPPTSYHGYVNPLNNPQPASQSGPNPPYPYSPHNHAPNFPQFPNKDNSQPIQPQPQFPPPYHGYVNPLSIEQPASQTGPNPYGSKSPHNHTTNFPNKDTAQPNQAQPQYPPYYGWVDPQTGQPLQPQSHHHHHPPPHHHHHPPYNNPNQPSSLPYPSYPHNYPQYPPYQFNGNTPNVQNNPYLYPVPPNQDPQRPPYGFPQVPPPSPQIPTTTEQYSKNKNPAKPPKSFPKFPGKNKDPEEDPIPSGSEYDPKYVTPTTTEPYEDVTVTYKGRTVPPKTFPAYPGKSPKSYDQNAEIIKDTKSPGKVTNKPDIDIRKLKPKAGFPEDSRNDFTSSEESPDNQYTTTEKPIKKIKFSPTNQTIRLRGGRSHLDGYLEVKMSDLTWGIACDEPNGWQIDEASVICKDLGFVRGAELSWQGYPIKSDEEEFHESLNNINCTGNEVTFAECNYTYAYETDSKCDVARNAIGIRCYPNLASHCQPGEIHYKERCYRLVENENPDDIGLTLGQASESCQKIGGRLVDINDQHENDFLSEWLVKNYPETDTVVTGGVGLSIMGSPIWIWEGSDDSLQYKQWWSGWTGKKERPIGKINDPVCIILRKTYKCSEDDEQSNESNGQQTGAELSNEDDKEECSADYFFWDVEPCQNLPQLKHPHICERPVDDIGCVVGRGEDYLGAANTTASGLPCLPWDHPKVQEGLARRFTPQERSARLTGHNYCRNLGGNDRHPWCFVEGKQNSEYCAIPQCYETVPGYSRSLKVKSSCSVSQFECKPGECINKQWFCDGDKDCSNGKDEEMCIIFLQEFVKSKDKRLKRQEKQKWPSTTENMCAKLCLESKNFKCKSFTYNVKEKYCFLSDTNSGLSGQVTPEKGWNYYERSADTIPCTMDNGFFECKTGQCVNISNVCDGKKHCSDNSDEIDCSRLGYEIRLAGGQEKHKGRIEIKILGQWGAICDDKFDLRDADVVCRELGFKHGAVEVLQHSQYPIEKPLFLVDDLDCRGNETSIRDCNFSGWGKHDCTAQETVGVVCRVSGVECPDGQWQCVTSKECVSTSYLCDNTLDCDDESDEDATRCQAPAQIRLAGGPNSTSGRLEIKRFDIWGTICDDDFNSGAATVACRILGYFGPSYVKKGAFFGPGKGPIWLDEVNCIGNETDLEKCAYSSWGQHNCKHDEDVSIICTKEESPNQKSLSLKPIAQNSIDEPEENKEEKLREVLLSECSDDKNGNYPKIIYKPNPQLARVVGSSVVAREEVPWQASVRVRTISGKTSHWCGAIVISPYHVLTAAHCLRDFKKAAYVIRTGDFDTEVSDTSEQEFEVDNFYMHPAFSKDLHLNNDIALVKIKGEMKFDANIRPACLAPSLELYKPGTNCTITGWGSISPQSSGYARTLRRAFVPILESSICKAPYVYKDRLSDGMFCAGHLDGGADSCQGDSGGPFMCFYEGKSYLFGITSWGLGCGRPNKPGVYTNVAYYLDWIQEKIKLSVS